MFLESSYRFYKKKMCCVAFMTKKCFGGDMYTFCAIDPGEDRQSQEIEEPEWDNERDERDDDGGGMTMRKTSGTNMS